MVFKKKDPPMYVGEFFCWKKKVFWKFWFEGALM